MFTMPSLSFCVVLEFLIVRTIKYFLSFKFKLNFQQGEINVINKKYQSINFTYLLKIQIYKICDYT